jgi:hypothetical protein
MVSVLVITVAPFHWRHNARRTTSERLVRSSMRIKRVTLIEPPGAMEMWNQRLATLVSALCFGCFRVGAALRYESRYSAHPLYLQ